ncbi:MAG: c-type cytochrome [Acidobacteriaceae bacterium]|nr:c-type cytochrome [Acidobacteriaceae bacterium]MBV9503029.1 c-type cytochrome [Acidobacteriaceae bacterium]
MNSTPIKTALIAIAAVIALQLVGGLLFMVSGTYNIAADEPHLKPVRWMLQAGRTRAIQMRSRGLHPPNLRDPSLLKRGLVLYRQNCQPCHGGPGTANEQIGRGIDPKPPPLLTASNKWDDSELFWIISHGLKLSGMPGFAPRLSETDLWGIVAFLRRVVLLSPAEYKRLTSAEDLGADDPLLNWPSNNDYGFAQLKAQGDAKRGLELLQSYGCISCHMVPGLAHQRSAGPPLTRFAERQYIAGSLVNVPSNAVAWITNPKQFKPQTLMPNLNVQPAEALHIAAYLYTSGSSDRLTALERNLQIAKESSTPKLN